MLFTVYIDILLAQLKDSVVGCYWDGLFVGALDDLILLTPCPSALRSMLKICKSFASAYGLKFNVSKTQLICFSLSSSKLCKAHYGERLMFSDTVCHLGHHIKFNLSDDEDIAFKCHDFLKKTNPLLHNFRFCSPSKLTFLFRSFCLSLYGCAL